MKIRTSQIGAFTEGASEDVEEQIVALLRDHFADTPAWRSDEAARDLARAAIAKAAALDMRAAGDAFRFAVMMLLFGPDFDATEAWARRVLGERSGNAPVADLLYEEAMNAVRAEEERRGR